MDELFLKTAEGIKPIEKSIVEKYSLSRGMTSPFTNMLIVDKNGNAVREEKKEELPTSIPIKEEITQMFTTAEILDIAQGADSY